MKINHTYKMVILIEQKEMNSKLSQTNLPQKSDVRRRFMKNSVFEQTSR